MFTQSMFIISFWKRFKKLFIRIFLFRLWMITPVIYNAHILSSICAMSMYLFELLRQLLITFISPSQCFYQMHLKLLMPIVDACSIKTIRIIWSVSDSRAIPRMSCQEQNMIEYIIFYWPYHCFVAQDFFAFHQKKE